MYRFCLFISSSSIISFYFLVIPQLEAKTGAIIGVLIPYFHY